MQALQPSSIQQQQAGVHTMPCLIRNLHQCSSSSRKACMHAMPHPQPASGKYLSAVLVEPLYAVFQVLHIMLQGRQPALM